MTPPDDDAQAPDPVSASFFLTRPASDAAMTYFYAHLFAAASEIRAMFPAAMDLQRRRFYDALAKITEGRDESGQLTAYLAELGRVHRKFGVREEHYESVRLALFATLRRFAASAWNDETEASWNAAYRRAADIMMTAAADESGRSPAWWVAEITGHQIRAPRLAVLTISPDEPFDYLPGQHVSVQTPRWPRLWRRYSIANAPRADGTLTLHVRAVPGGLVSNALVHHAHPGDTLLLGQAGGTMTADTHSSRDVLCLAGGTGLAPLKAIAEALCRPAEPGRHREIVLYHGMRHARDLYDMTELQRMELDYPWLQVIPVTSAEAAPGMLHGAIPALVPKAGWAGRDVYVSGPDAMIAGTVRTLLRLGAPPESIRYDVAGDLDLTAD